MVDQPSGTVSFLFTDIEGSTKRWESDPAEMAVALAQHDTLLRAAIAGQRGYVFKTVGDAFCAAFAVPEAALAAALAAQQALLAAPWGAAGRLRVRMALHTGTAARRDDDYFGPPLNRVARLLASGAGDQILLSHASAALVRDHLPAGVRLRDLGAHRLKDLARPEQIFQVVALDAPWALPDRVAPLKTLDAHPTNLPQPPTPLIGREQEVAAAVALLGRAEVRLVSFTGPGGIGKTRLSLQVAAELTDTCPDGVFFVALETVREAAGVPAAVAAVLGVHESAGRPIAARLHDELHAKALLLVLDNFEQVVAAAAWVSELLAATTRLKVLVTTRTLLHVRGEYDFPVPPLAQPPPGPQPPAERLSQYAAVALFIARAQAVRPGFAVDNASAPAVAEICVRLDGLPLAIELAAARIRNLAPDALLARLQRDLQVLKGGARDLPARQQTLWATIGWSYDLLDPTAQSLFRSLAPFAGGCALETAEEYLTALAWDGDVLDGLAALADQSLIRAETDRRGASRYGLLETIRAFATAQLATAGAIDAARNAHLICFLALAEAADAARQGGETAAWTQRLEIEHDNLRAALAWALSQGPAEAALRLASALGRFWYGQSYFREGRDWLQQALAAGAGAAPALRARALGRLGNLLWILGDYPDARARFVASLALAEAAGEAPTRARALIGLGDLAHDQGDLATAHDHYAAALTLQRTGDDRPGLAQALSRLADVLSEQGDPTGPGLQAESMALYRALGDRSGLAWGLLSEWNAALQRADGAAAQAHAAEALALFRALGDGLGTAAALNAGGMAADQVGDLATATALHTESLALQRQIGDRLGIAISHENLGRLAHHGGDLPAAREHYLAALRIYRALVSQPDTVAVLAGLAALALATGDAAQAARLAGTVAAADAAGAFRPSPVVRREYAGFLAALAATADEAERAAAWAVGQTGTPEQVADALLAATPATAPEDPGHR